MLDTVTFRRINIILFELAIVVLANYMAFLLRFDGSIPAAYFTLFARALPFVLLTRALIFIPFRLYEGLWRYTSIWDLRNIGAAVVLSTALIHITLNTFLRLGYPRSILFVDALLVLCLLTGIRLTRRIVRDIRMAN